MKKQDDPKNVSVLGLGVMGAALARLLVKEGYRVTVWNRTPEKADTLIREGAVRAANVAEAIEASPLVIICVHNYQATNEILKGEEVVAALAGKTIVQLTTGSPQDARESEVWANQNGAEYIDGAILATPAQMGSPDTIILFSGKKDAYESVKGVLKIFGGKLTYLGEKSSSASAMDLAVLSYTYGAALGFFHGVRIGEVEGFQADVFGQIIADFSPTIGGFIKYESDVIQKGDFAATESAIRISIEAVDRLLKTAQESGINTEFPRFASSIFQQAKEAGYADEEIAALIKVFRHQK